MSKQAAVLMATLTCIAGASGGALAADEADAKINQLGSLKAQAGVGRRLSPETRLNNEGVKLMAAGRFAEAITKFKESLAVKPGYSVRDKLAKAHKPADLPEPDVGERASTAPDYLKEVQRKITDQWQKDTATGKGSVEVTLTISRDGDLLSVDVAKSSGDTTIDAKAVEVVRKSAPFSPFIKGMRSDKVKYTLPLTAR